LKKTYGISRSASPIKDGSARENCEAIVRDGRATAEQNDDLSLVVIKHC